MSTAPKSTAQVDIAKRIADALSVENLAKVLSPENVAAALERLAHMVDGMRGKLPGEIVFTQKFTGEEVKTSVGQIVDMLKRAGHEQEAQKLVEFVQEVARAEQEPPRGDPTSGFSTVENVTAFPLDLAETERYLKRLDPTATSFTFFTVDDVLVIVDGKEEKRDDARLRRTFNGTLAEHAAELTRRNRLGAGVYVTIGETDLTGRATHNMRRVRSCWREDDDGVRPTKPLPLVPQMVVESSPGKAHEYLLVDGMTPEQHRDVQEVMVEQWGSCPDAKDLCRVLRVPGFWHMKRQPYRVRILHLDDRSPYSAAEVVQAFPPLPKPEPKPHTANAEIDWAEVREALKFVNKVDERQRWLMVGMALHHADPHPSGDGWECWTEWAQQSTKFQWNGSEVRWDSFGKRRRGRPLTIRYVFKLALANGWKPKRKRDDESGFSTVGGIEPDMSILDRHIIPAPRFPVEILGELGTWAEQQAEMRNCPVDFVAAAILSACATTIGHTRKVQAWPTFVQPCVLWNIIAGDPSVKKTPPLNSGLDALTRLEAKLAKKAAPAQREYEARKHIASTFRKEWERQVAEAVKAGKSPIEMPPMPMEANEPVEPALPRLRVGEVTAEKVLDMLARQRRGLCWARQELAGMLAGLNQYRGGKGNDRQLVLEAYDAGPLPRDRMKDSVQVESVHINIVGGMQPDKVNGMLLQGDDDGLFARGSFYWPDRVALEVPDGDLRDTGRLDEVLDRLIQLDYDMMGQPIVLLLDAAARAVFDPWYRAQEPKQKVATGLYAGAIGKRQGLVLRLAVVLEHINWACGARAAFDPPQRVGAEAVKAAIALCDGYFDGMLIRVLEGTSVSLAERAGRTLALAIIKGRLEVVNARVLRYRKRVKGLPPDKVETALAHLVERGWLFKAEKDDDAKEYGGREPGDYTVNPEVHRLAPKPDK